MRKKLNIEITRNEQTKKPRDRWNVFVCVWVCVCAWRIFVWPLPIESLTNLTYSLVTFMTSIPETTLRFHAIAFILDLVTRAFQWIKIIHIISKNILDIQRNWPFTLISYGIQWPQITINRIDIKKRSEAKNSCWFYIHY